MFHLHNLSTAPRQVFNNMTGDPNKAFIVTLSELALYSAANDPRPLNSIGIHRSNHTMREDIVKYPNNNPTAADRTPLQNITDLPLPTYLSSMSQNGTFGDHRKLGAASNLYNVMFISR